ncbi:MAG: CBS domain-containing protein [Anaerolineae bacterium]|nr:CBS domain-containing protein [Anaerolineae bacterium]
MTLANDLKREQVIHLDLNRFTTVESGTSVRETVEKMQANSHHCAFITDKGSLTGIFTDRDILHRVVDSPDVWDQPVDTVMTPSPSTVKSNDAADAALALMDEKHFRNVPVVNDSGEVVGNLTHYAIIKYLADRFPESVYNLPPDPDQVTNNRDGA